MPEAVRRAEVFVALTALGYVPFTLVALAFHGWLFTGLTTPAGGGQATSVADTAQTDAVEALRSITSDLTRAVATGFDDVGGRLGTIEARLNIDPDRPEAAGHSGTGHHQTARRAREGTRIMASMEDKRSDSNRDDMERSPGGAKVGGRLDDVLADLAAISTRLEAVEADIERLREAERAVGARP